MSLWVILIALIGSYYGIARLLSVYALVFNRHINEVQRDWSYTPKVSVMMSCFNEGQGVYESIRSILESDYPRDKLEVIVFDDCSQDNSFEWIKKAAALSPECVTARRNLHNRGKSKTMIEISTHVTGDIVIATDSDMIFDKHCIRELVSCFANPEIGAVGGQVRIRNLNDSCLTQMQALYYARVFYLYKSIENLALTARCLTGQMFAVRRELYLPLMKFVRSRNFLGQPITYGEDTFLTSHIVFGEGLDKPYKVFTNLKALSWTVTPATWKAYMNQQMRWRRGTFANGLRLVPDLASRAMRAGFAPVLISTAPMMVALSFIFTAWYLFNLGVLLTTLAGGILGMVFATLPAALVYNFFIGRNDPMGKLKNPFMAGVIFALWLPINLYTLSWIALFTLDDGGWVTRQGMSNEGRMLA